MHETSRIELLAATLDDAMTHMMRDQEVVIVLRHAEDKTKLLDAVKHTDF